jgi:hypothetical protein
MLVVAFICFFVLLVAWLLAPTAVPQAAPATPVEPDMVGADGPAGEVIGSALA